MSDPYVLSEKGPANPRRVIAFSDLTRATTKGISKDTNGRYEIITEASDVATWKMDFSNALDEGEKITHVTVEGHAKAQIYDEGTAVFIRTNNPPSCASEVFVSVSFNTGERSTSRFIVRQPADYPSIAPQSRQTRGVV